MPNEIQSGRTIAHALIQEQLKRIRTSPQFSHSHRYPTFLEYVVSKTLSGQQEELKERTIGVEAFGRSPQYDLNADPVVRVTAGEVRKRLAQYYYEPEHQAELRIELRTGSYVPEFRFVSTAGNAHEPAQPSAPDALPPVEQALPASEPDQSRSSAPLSNRRYLFLLAACVLLAAAIWSAFQVRRISPLVQFWQPIIDSPGPVAISVGSVATLNSPILGSNPSDASVGLHPLFAGPIALADATAISNFQQVLFHYSKASSIQSSTMTTYSDLQGGPVILVSGFNNPWTMRLTDSLRFRFLHTAVDTYEIVDRTDPVHKRWTINSLLPFKDTGHDFGIVARVHDPTIEQIVIVAAGIGENGTIAASKLLCDKKYLAELRQQGLLPKRDQNWEAVIETEMIDGKPGPPHIIASYSW